MKAANVSVLDRRLNLIYWFVFLGFRPTRQKLLKECSIGITSALAKYVKHIQIPAERVANYDLYLHMFNHIYLISSCCFCSPPPPALGRGPWCWYLGALSKVLSSEHSAATLLVFCVIFSNEIWNLQFLNDVCEIIWRLCHNIIHPKILVGVLPLPHLSPTPPEIRALLRK